MNILIIGAGAAGLMAAGTACKAGHNVTILEHSTAPGQKILVTGKGRCNVTNDCTQEEFLKEVRVNERFLFSSLSSFLPCDAMKLFEQIGVKLKVERGRRVFPVSDSAEEIRLALIKYAENATIIYDEAKELMLQTLPTPPITETADKKRTSKKQKTPIYKCHGVRGRSGKEYKADAVLVATGGLSYANTGSTGDGYKFAESAGHNIVTPAPCLVSLVARDKTCAKMMGLSLKNITLTLYEGEKAVFKEQGELLFTHFGISGPLTLSASGHIRDLKKHRYTANIDLKPALSEEQLYDRITRDFLALSNATATAALAKLLPASMRPVMVERWGINPETKANQITKEQKQELLKLIKNWQVPIKELGDLAHAVITAGGVNVKEIDPKTMQSKKAEGLYFAGEVLDVDATTGGYNLQIAWCTAQAFARNL